MGVSDDLSAFRSDLEARGNLVFDTSLDHGRVSKTQHSPDLHRTEFEGHVGRQTEQRAFRGDEISEMQHQKSMESANGSGALGMFSSLNFSSFEVTTDPAPEQFGRSRGSLNPDFSSFHISDHSVKSPERRRGVRQDPLFNDLYSFPSTREDRQRSPTASPRKDAVMEVDDDMAVTPSLVDEEFHRTLGELTKGNGAQNEYMAGITVKESAVKRSLSPKKKYALAHTFDETGQDVDLNSTRATHEMKSPSNQLSSSLFRDHLEEQTRSSFDRNKASRTVEEYLAEEERQTRPGTSQSNRYLERSTPQISAAKPSREDLDKYRDYLDISADANRKSDGKVNLRNTRADKLGFSDHLADAEDTGKDGNDFDSHLVQNSVERFGGPSDAEISQQQHSSSNQFSSHAMDKNEDNISNIIEGTSEIDFVEELHDPTYFPGDAQSDLGASASKFNGKSRSKIESPVSSVASSFMDFTQNNTVNIDDEPPQHRPLFSLPVEGNSRVVISALRSLQDKIAKLENERAISFARMDELERELDRYRHLLHDQKRRESVAVGDRDNLEKEKEEGEIEKFKLLDVNSELRSRNTALERQVEYLNFVTENVNDENDLVRQQLLECRSQLLAQQKIRSQNGGSATPELNKEGRAEKKEEIGNPPSELPGSKINKSFVESDDISLLEQEIQHDRQSRSGREKRNLTKEQVKSLRDTILRDRISEKKGPDQKNLDRPTNVEQGGRSRRKVGKNSRPTATTEPFQPIWRKVESNNRANIALDPPLIRRAWSAGAQQGAASTVGVHGNVKDGIRGRDIPFVVGTSVGKSYSVTANIQRMLSLVKAHNPHSCAVCNHRNQRTMVFEKVPREHVSRGRTGRISHANAGDNESRWLRPGVTGGGKDGEEGLKKIISTLEDELKHLKMQYQQLMRDYENIEPRGNGKQSLSEKIQEVIDMMELRTYQIGTLRDISSIPNYTGVGPKSAHVRSRSQPSGLAHQHTQNTTAAASGFGGATLPAAALHSATAAAVAAVGGHGSKSPNRAMALLRGSMKVQEALHDAV